MIWHIQSYDQKTDSNTVDNVIYNLTWDDNKDPHIVAGFRSLSRQQVKAVDAFLAFIASQTHDSRLADAAAKARESFWASPAA